MIYSDSEKKILLLDSAIKSTQYRFFISKIKPYIDNSIRETAIEDPDEAIIELSKGIYPLALIEHRLFYAYKEDGKFLMKLYETHKLIPSFIEASQETQYIITDHSGYAMGKDKAYYDPYPQVLKTMGYLCAKVNSIYLIRIIKKIYTK